MDIETALNAYRCGIFSLGEAMAEMVPDTVHTDMRAAYLETAYRLLTQQETHVSEWVQSVAFIMAKAERQLWINRKRTQSSSVIDLG